MIAESDHRRVVIPPRLHCGAARALPAWRPVGETRARGFAISRSAARAVARRAVRGLRDLGEVDGYGD